MRGVDRGQGGGSVAVIEDGRQSRDALLVCGLPAGCGAGCRDDRKIYTDAGKATHPAITKLRALRRDYYAGKGQLGGWYAVAHGDPSQCGVSGAGAKPSGVG